MNHIGPFPDSSQSVLVSVDKIHLRLHLSDPQIFEIFTIYIPSSVKWLWNLRNPIQKPSCPKILPPNDKEGKRWGENNFHLQNIVEICGAGCLYPLMKARRIGPTLFCPGKTAKLCGVKNVAPSFTLKMRKSIFIGYISPSTRSLLPL